MKKLMFLLVIAFTINTVAVAQKTAKSAEGVIYFDEVVNLHRRIKDDQMKAQVPEFRTQSMMLTFKGDEALYEPATEEEAQPPANGVMMMRFMSAVHYYNNATRERIEQRDMMDSTFLIIDTVRTLAWTLGEGTKKIAGFDCKKATLNDSTFNRNPVEVWYTESIALSSGPQGFYGLTGMILEVNVNNGEIVATAKMAEMRRIKASDVKKPTKGTVLSRAQWQQRMKGMGRKFMRGPRRER
ncbi:MAG: hypothetical protein RL757_447 [Bacteroidota bacterium]|jgi:GLPGLI family protein